MPNLRVRRSRASIPTSHTYLTAELPFGGDPRSVSYSVGKLHRISHCLLKTQAFRQNPQFCKDGISIADITIIPALGLFHASQSI